MTAIMCAGPFLRDDRTMAGALMTWDAAATVEGFVRSPANQILLQYAARIRRGDRATRVLDIGCGAGRELNLPPPGHKRLGGPPIIFEGGFIHTGT